MPISWQYIAGFTDGEGYIAWRPGRGTGRAGRGPIIILGQKTIEPLDQIRDFLMEAGCEKPRLYLRKAYGKKSTSLWILTLTNKHDCGIFLKGTLPFLIVKNSVGTNCLTEIDANKRHTRMLKDEDVLPLLAEGFTVESVTKILHVSRAKLEKYLDAHGIVAMVRRKGTIIVKQGNGLSKLIPSMTPEEYKKHKLEAARIKRCPDCGIDIYQLSARCISCAMKKRHRENPESFKASVMTSVRGVLNRGEAQEELFQVS